MGNAAEPGNRAELLACALRLFVGRGYDAVGVQELVDAARVTKPTLYHYFGSKLGLLEALLTERLQPLLTALESAPGAGEPLPAALRALARATFAFARQAPDAYRLHLSLWFAPVKSDAHRAAARLHARQFALVEARFREADAAPGRGARARRANAATFLSLLNGHVALALNDHATLGDNLVERCVDQFLYGALGRQPRRKGASPSRCAVSTERGGA